MVDIESIGVLIWMLILTGLITCGAVLLVNLFLSKMGFANRIITSVASSQAVTFLPIFALGDVNLSGDWWAALLGIAVVLVVVGVVISWPIAHFTTRRLDRSRENAASVFE